MRLLLTGNWDLLIHFWTFPRSDGLKTIENRVHYPIPLAKVKEMSGDQLKTLKSTLSRQMAKMTQVGNIVESLHATNWRIHSGISGSQGKRRPQERPGKSLAAAQIGQSIHTAAKGAKGNGVGIATH